MPARINSGRWLSLLAAVLFCWTSGSVVHADVVLDGSLGASGPLSGPDFTIDAVDGRTVSTNLFHSFSEFNLSSSQSATFTGPASIDNVLGRVTGGSASSIDGLLRSTIPNANLFLVNPHGILFGPNASLDVQGSFHASTGDYIGLADSTQFTALPSAQDALLTTAAPSAFGFLGSNPGAITVDYSQLSVPPGQNLSFVGGDLTITGTDVNTDNASLTTEGRTVNLVSVASPGEATFTSPINADGFSDYGDIAMTESTIDVSGEGGGTVFIRGHRLVIDHSTIDADTLGDGDGGRLDIGLTDEFAMRNSADIHTLALADGRAGDIELDVKRLTLTEGSHIDNGTRGAGAGGNMMITATDAITIAERDSAGDPSGLFNNSNGSGDGGSIQIATDTLEIKDSLIQVEARKAGNAGDVVVDVRTMTLIEGGQIETGTRGAGRGGRVTVNATDTLTFSGRRRSSGGGRRASGIFSDARGSGDAGSVAISAPALALNDGRVSAFTFAGGDGGNIELQVGRLTLTDRSQVGSRADDVGQGGNVTIDAREIIVDDRSEISARSLSESLSELIGADPGVGRSGNITMTVSDSLRIHNDSSLTVETAQANAGDIALNVGALVQLVNKSTITSAVGSGTGTGGDITTQSTSLAVRSGSRIDASTSGAGDGGDINITATTVTLAAHAVEGFTGISTVAAAGATGNAGNINLTVGDTFESFSGRVSAAADQSDGGNITITATNMVNLVDSAIETAVQGGVGAGGNISIDPQFVVLNSSNITANAFGGPGGNIRIVAGNFFATPSSVIQASSAQSIAGTVEIDSPDTDVAASIARLPESFLDASALLPQHCAARHGSGQSSFIVAGRGGMPIDPDGYLPSFHAAGLTTLSASADSAMDTIPETWVSTKDVAALALVNSGCR